MTHRFLAAVLSILGWLAAYPAMAADSVPLKNSGIMERLVKQTGVYNRSATAKTPDFVSDPAWPQPLPNNWLLGQIGGLTVDSHDNVWVYNRPRSLTNDEAGLDKALPGVVDAKGQPINGLGFPRVNGFGADCCNAAPAVMQFNAAGKLLRSWGGPADPGYLAAKCREQDGCIWPNVEHGIFVDAQDNVWIAGNSAGVPKDVTPWTTNKQGGDGFLLKFDVDGNFKMRIGGTPTGPNSNDTDGGLNGTPLLYQPADVVVDVKTNRLYIADGYGNRRILILDATTGKYIGHFGAYGGNPVDDGAAKAAGSWNDQQPGTTKPAFFRNPVHCVKIAGDGKIYVCDRGNDRLQVFDGKDPSLGKPCSNPVGEAGKCGFVTERWISERTYAPPVLSGTAISVSFSTDKAQSCLYVGDLTNETIYILNRRSLEELGRLGKSGRMAGDLHWLHQVSLDSKGNIYTGEVDNGKRIQKFIHYGASGCSGSGSTTIGGPKKVAGH